MSNIDLENKYLVIGFIIYLALTTLISAMAIVRFIIWKRTLGILLLSISSYCLIIEIFIYLTEIKDNLEPFSSEIVSSLNDFIYGVIFTIIVICKRFRINPPCKK